MTADAAGTSTVSSVAFLGAISRVYAAMGDGTVICAQMGSPAARHLAPGDSVSVGVESDGVLASIFRPG